MSRAKENIITNRLYEAGDRRGRPQISWMQEAKEDAEKSGIRWYNINDVM